MTPEHMAQLLEPGLRKIYFDGYRERPEIFPQVVGVATSNKHAEHFHRIAGLTVWPEFKGAVEYEEYEPGQTYSVRHTTYAKGLQIPYDMAEDDLYGIIGPRGTGIGGRRAKQLGRGARIRAERLAADMFNNAFDSTKQQLFDGKALCATDHPILKPSAKDGVTMTVSNKLEYTLTEGAVKEARLLMRQQLDDSGMLIQTDGRQLLVPPALEHDALVITMSTQRPGTDYNDANTVRGMLNRDPIVWDYLLDDNAWFLLDPNIADESLLFFWRIRPMFRSRDDSDHFMLKFVGRMRASVIAADWRGIVGSTGTKDIKDNGNGG